MQAWKKKLPFIQVYGAEVFLHWTVLPFTLLPVLALANNLIQATVLFCLAILITFVHEVGHAFLAKRLGYQPIAIGIDAFHGYCVYEALENESFERDRTIIAWGGVLAQLAIAVPLIIAANTTSFFNDGFMAPVVAMLGYWNALIATLNLIPIRSFDGQLAWKLHLLWKKSENINEFKDKKPKARLKRVK